MNKVSLTAYLQENNLILVDKKAFFNFMIEVNKKTKVDRRVFYITRKEAMIKYSLNAYWFRKYEDCLKMIKTAGLTSTKKYSEQSIINELEKQTEI